MSANTTNVQKLIAAAWIGMNALMENEGPGIYSAEDVVNAAINVARGGVIYACKCGRTDEETNANKRAVRSVLQQMLLDTAESGAGGVQ